MAADKNKYLIGSGAFLLWVILGGLFLLLNQSSLSASGGQGIWAPAAPAPMWREYHSAAEVEFNRPLAVAVDARGYMYVADSGNGRVAVLKPNGKTLTVIDGLSYPADIDVDAQGGIYVADLGAGRVAVFDQEGSASGTITLAGEKMKPTAVEVDGAGRIWVSDVLNQEILQFDRDGKLVGKFGRQGSGRGQLSFANGIAVYDDTVYVSDTNNARIQSFAADGEFLAVQSASGLVAPKGMAVNASGTVLVIADPLTHQLIKFDVEKRKVERLGTMGTGERQFRFPNGVALDNEEVIYVADRENNRVVAFRP